MRIPRKLLFVLAVSLFVSSPFAQAGPLAEKGELILSNPFEGSLEKKELVEIKDGWQRRVSFGEWTLNGDGSVTAVNIPEDGHGPVLTYIAPVRDLIVECEFKVPAEPKANRHFRIFLDHQDYRGHTIQSTANLSSVFRPVGLTLQHISKSSDADKKILQDIEFGPIEMDLKPETWYKMRLDIVGDKAWTVVNGTALSGQNKVLDVEKSKIGLNPGIAGGSIRNFKVWTVKRESDDAGVEEALGEINDRFLNVEVEIVEWPKDVQDSFGNIKRLAFMASPENRPSGKLPLLISLHGAGGKEMSLKDQLVRSAKVKGLALAERAGKDFFLLEPNSADSWDPNTLDRMLDYVLDTYDDIDKSRVYVMGHSMGGTGTWNWILQSGDQFAAAAPCGFSTGANPEGVERLVDLPIWGMVGGDDGKNVIGVQTMVDNLRAAGNRNVRHTAFPGAKHSQGNAAVFSSVELVDWMLSFSNQANAVAASDGDWLSWRGPYGNGVASAGQTLPVEWSETKHIQWKASVPGRGHSTPIVVGDRIFLTTAREDKGSQSVLCYSFSSGELLWEKILIEGKLPERIHRKNTHASPSVVSDGERIFALFFVAGDRLHLFSLDLKGNELWHEDAGRFYPERHFGYGSTPLLAGGNVVVSAESEGDGFIAGFDADTGKEVWRTRRTAERSSFGTPVLADINGSSQIVLNGADRVASYDPQSGRELWSVAGGDPLIANTVLWKDGVIFASGGYPGTETWAIDVEKQKAIWSSPARCYEQSMLVVDDHLYGVGEGGLVHCWDPASGEILWRERLPKGPESASLIFAGGYIFHANEEGKIFVIKPNSEKLDLVAENQLGDEIFASPVICRDRILIRSAKYDGEARSETLYSIGF